MVVEFFEAFFFVFWSVRVVFRQVPILADADFSVFEFEEVPCGQFADCSEGRERLGHVAEVEILEQGLRIDLGEFGRDGENTFDFGAKV